VRARALSLRRACGLIGMSRATPSYELRLPPKDPPVLAAMKVLSAQYPRYGYRRIRVFLRHGSFERSWSRTHRLWRRASLLVPPKTAAQARRLGAPAHPHAVRAQRDLSLRLRLRHHCQRSAN